MTLVNNLTETLTEIAFLAKKFKRLPESVQLLAVSKLHSIEAIAEIANAGQIDFGENYIQEARAKQQDALCPKNINWHFIGHLQTNKIKYIVPHFTLIHSVDSLKLAQAINKKAEQHKIIQNILLQVNVGEEPQKSGIMANELFTLVEAVLKMPHLNLQGLMTLPPFFDDGVRAQPFFKILRELKDSCCDKFGIKLPHLSMGMTGDFPEAIAEGATLIRIGTKIFGNRK